MRFRWSVLHLCVGAHACGCRHVSGHPAVWDWYPAGALRPGALPRWWCHPDAHRERQVSYYTTAFDPVCLSLCISLLSLSFMDDWTSAFHMTSLYRNPWSGSSLWYQSHVPLLLQRHCSHSIRFPCLKMKSIIPSDISIIRTEFLCFLQDLCERNNDWFPGAPVARRSYLMGQQSLLQV